jgi:hypothetical protein
MQEVLYNYSIDYSAIRKAVVQEIQRDLGIVCIVEEQSRQNLPRPEKPYISIKTITPMLQVGDDDYREMGDGKTNYGGQRSFVVSINCYGNTQEEAYQKMGLLNALLNTQPVIDRLRRSRIAIWDIGDIADLSQLLNTGYEGRAHMDVTMAIASNIETDLGVIEEAEISGEVDDQEIEITVES